MSNTSVLRRVLDIQREIEEIRERVHGLSEDPFLASRSLQKEIAYSLIVIAEAAKALPDDIKQSYSHVPWRQIIDMRNVLVHEYGAVNASIVWRVTSDKLSELGDAIVTIKQELLTH